MTIREMFQRRDSSMLHIKAAHLNDQVVRLTREIEHITCPVQRHATVLRRAEIQSELKPLADHLRSIKETVR